MSGQYDDSRLKRELESHYDYYEDQFDDEDSLADEVYISKDHCFRTSDFGSVDIDGEVTEGILILIGGAVL